MGLPRPPAAGNRMLLEWSGDAKRRAGLRVDLGRGRASPRARLFLLLFDKDGNRTLFARLKHCRCARITSSSTAYNTLRGRMRCHPRRSMHDSIARQLGTKVVVSHASPSSIAAVSSIGRFPQRHCLSSRPSDQTSFGGQSEEGSCIKHRLSLSFEST